VRRGINVTSALLGVVFLVFVWDWLVDRMIFYPEPGVDLRPEQLDVVGEDVRILTEDGVRVHAFFLPNPGATRAILFLHGNAGNASHRLPNAAALMQLGSHVLLLDYRGYGLSEGRPDEAGVYADARAGLAHLVDHVGIPERRTVVFGRSLGGAVADSREHLPLHRRHGPDALR
jgi:predicted alpha/beta-fold hydrolase